MPQLDIYRALDEILIILSLLVIIYLLMILIIMPLLIKRIGIQTGQEEIQNIEILKKKIQILKINLEILEEKNIVKI